MSSWMRLAALAVVASAISGSASIAADEPTPAQRGEKALLTRHFTPAAGPVSAYENLWKVWGMKEKPADLLKEVVERYGLHPAPYPNGGYPMGFREADLKVFGVAAGKGLATDCMLCHGGSIA